MSINNLSRCLVTIFYINTPTVALSASLGEGNWLDFGFESVDSGDDFRSIHPIELGSSRVIMTKINIEKRLLGVPFAPPRSPENVSPENVLSEIDNLYENLMPEAVYLIWISNVLPRAK